MRRRRSSRIRKGMRSALKCSCEHQNHGHRSCSENGNQLSPSPKLQEGTLNDDSTTTKLHNTAHNQSLCGLTYSQDSPSPSTSFTRNVPNSEQSEDLENSDEVLPEFDPAIKNRISANTWIKKVNNYAEKLEWNDDKKVHLATSRLRGNAILWYQSRFSKKSGSSILRWQEFSKQFRKQFSDNNNNNNFGQLLEEMVHYQSNPGQDLQDYCSKKISKINQLNLNLSEDKIVDIVVHGIHDDDLRLKLRMLSCKTIVELNNYLNAICTPNNK